MKQRQTIQVDSDSDVEQLLKIASLKGFTGLKVRTVPKKFIGIKLSDTHRLYDGDRMLVGDSLEYIRIYLFGLLYSVKDK